MVSHSANTGRREIRDKMSINSINPILIELWCPGDSEKDQLIAPFGRFIARAFVTLTPIRCLRSFIRMKKQNEMDSRFSPHLFRVSERKFYFVRIKLSYRAVF